MRLQQALMLLVVLCVTPCALANKGDKTSTNISMSGTVVVNGSCTFNHDGTVQVDFGEVKLKSTGSDTVQLDGDYVQPLASDFDCTGDSAGLLQMSFTSSSGSYETYQGTKVLGVDKGIVGIQLLVNGTAQNMGTWFSVDQNHPPTLQAKLVQVSDTNSKNVTSGEIFTASGTLKLAFN